MTRPVYYGIAGRVLLGSLALPGTVLAQEAAATTPPPPAQNERLKISVSLMAGYGYDPANAPLGFESQGRIGYATLGVEGRVLPRVTYRFVVNPVNEVTPRPACNEKNFFYPNAPSDLWGAGPPVPCDVAYGTRRVDMYRGIALDTMSQQGALREASATFEVSRQFRVTFGRFPLAKGFGVEEAGSFTAKDAPMIQRINAESSFGLQLSYLRADATRTRLALHAAGVIGEGNRWQDYNYFYFQDGSLDANSAMTFFASATIAPTSALDMRVAFKAGFTGSKVERLPSYWASKRNDGALVVSAQYRVMPRVRVMGEFARYTWGPTRTSAEMLGVDTSAIIKNGYWIGVEARQPIGRSATIGGSIAREEIDRADALIKTLAAQGMYGVREGKSDRLAVVRLFLDFSDHVRIGYYFSGVQNPYPWVSGIYPVAGQDAFKGRSLNRWGIVVRLRAEN